MKKIILIIIGIILIPFTVQALSGVTTPLLKNGTIESTLYTGDSLQATFFTATSTTGTSTFAGKVGIGTTTPGQKLSVGGDILGNKIIGSYFQATSTATSTFVGGIRANGLQGVNYVVSPNVYGNMIKADSGYGAYKALTAIGNYDSTSLTNSIFSVLSNIDPSTIVPIAGIQGSSLGLGWDYGNFIVAGNGTNADFPAAGQFSFWQNDAPANPLVAAIEAQTDIATATYRGTMRFSLRNADTLYFHNPLVMRNDSVGVNMAFSNANTYPDGTASLTVKNFDIEEPSSQDLLRLQKFDSNTGDYLEVLDSAGNYVSRITTDGLVGIATTTPGQALSVTGDILSSSSTIAPYFLGYNPLATSTLKGGLQVAGSAGLNVMQNGRIGINTIDPLTQLYLNTTGTTDPSATGATGSFTISPSAVNVVADMGWELIKGNYDFYIQAKHKTTPNSRFPIAINPWGGNVGVGTTTPTTSFHVSSNSQPAILLERVGTSNATIQFKTTTGDVYFGQPVSAGFAIGPYATLSYDPYMFISGTTRHFGIGTTTPIGRFSVSGLSGSTSQLVNMSTSTALSTSTAFLIDANGKVGIGTSTPYTQLDVAGKIRGTIGDIGFPYASLSSSVNQQASTTPGSVYFNTNDAISYMSHSATTDTATTTILESGTYEISLSAIVSSTVAAKHASIWLQVNNIDVPRSATLIEPPVNSETIISVPLVYTFSAGDKFQLRWAADTTSMTMNATAAGAIVTGSPASPSIIMTVKKISK